MLEWSASAYFAHHPRLEIAFANQHRDAILSFQPQQGWSYRLRTCTGWGAWEEVAEVAGTGAWLEIPQPGRGADVCRFWWLETVEGPFGP